MESWMNGMEELPQLFPEGNLWFHCVTLCNSVLDHSGDVYLKAVDSYLTHCPHYGWTLIIKNDKRKLLPDYLSILAANEHT